MSESPRPPGRPAPVGRRTATLRGLLVLVLTAALGLLGCGHRRYFDLERVVAAGQGRFWAAGTEGLAAYYDGGLLRRHDYPLAEDADDWEYASRGSELPTVGLVVADGQPYLLTRRGEVLRWTGRDWSRLSVRLPGEQLNRVLVRPEGGLVMQLHPDLLLWTERADDLASGRWRATRTPSYFDWLGFVGGELCAVGWDQGGNTRAVLVRREGRWDVLVRFEPGPSFTPIGVARAADGGLLAFGRELVVQIGSGGKGARMTSLARWLGPLLGPSQPPAAGVYAYGLVTAPDLPPLLLVQAGVAAVAELRPDGARLVNCGADLNRLAGAVAQPDGSALLVGAHGELWRLTDDGCREEAAASLPTSD